MKEKYGLFQESKIKNLFVILIIFVALCGLLYIYYAWEQYTRDAQQEAIGLAVSVASFIQPERLMNLKGNLSDLDSDDYLSLKNSLVDIKQGKPEIGFAYLLTMKDGSLYIIADSESPQSEYYSPPGQEFSEAASLYKEPFLTGEPILTIPITDRWGTWVSALAPVKDPDTGEVLAVFGIDYPAGYWQAEVNRYLLHSTAVVACILLLLMLLCWVILNNYRLAVLSRELKDTETLFRTGYEQAPIGIALLDCFHFISMGNTEFARILGRTRDEIASLNWNDVTHPDDLPGDLEYFKQCYKAETPGHSLERRFIRPDGTGIWVNMTASRLRLTSGNVTNDYYLCMVQDIQARKEGEEALQESERSRRVLLENLPGMAYRCKFDEHWTMEFVSKGCYDLTGYKSESLLYNRELSFNDLIVPEYRDVLWAEWERVIEERRLFRYEYEIITATGERKWVLETGQGVFGDDGEVVALEGIIIDITETKEKQRQIEYFSDHDLMTGVYNRRYYEEAKARLDREDQTPTAIIIADINGVRLINDAYGTEAGDRLIIEAAKILQRCSREGDILARTGGDEFRLLLPKTNRYQANKILKAIQEDCHKFNAKVKETERRISLSVGMGIKAGKECTWESAEKEADESLRRHKLFEQKSMYNTILSSIMATMYAKSQETEEHSQRLSEKCIKVAERLGLPQNKLDELHLCAMLHDIGKVGIDDRILNKPGKLTEAEWAIMKTHPEIGYRIVMSAPELSSAATVILAHHERWDGKGYPLGLSGEEIPLLARILAIVDAYDAMTQERVYRKALPKELALKEIEKNAGIQFDPTIARIFVELMRDED